MSTTLVTIQIRRATTTEWTTENPILSEGEFGLDTTLQGVSGSDYLKLGDGVNRWSALPWFSGSGGGSGTTIDTTYESLTTLISISGLTENQTYCITDFQTNHLIENTTDFHTGEIEPLVVTAKSTSTLSPLAVSRLFPTDIIFYEIVNTGQWGGAVSFLKGRIYRRIDKYNNDIPEDFRNTVNRRWSRVQGGVTIAGTGNFDLITPQSITYRLSTSSYQTIVFSGTSEGQGDVQWIQYLNQNMLPYKMSIGQDGWIGIYTVVSVVSDGTNWTVTVSEDIDFTGLPEYSGPIYFYDDFYMWSGKTYDSSIPERYTVNNKIEQGIDGWYREIGQPVNIVFHSQCFENTFSADCHSMTFNGDTFGNEFVGYDDETAYNSFGSGCINNKFGRGFSSNYFGNGCRDNIYGSGCIGNIIGNNSQTNRIGDYFRDNIAGHGFNGNIINSSYNYTSDNIFGDYFENNILEDYFQHNIFGSDCRFNIFGLDFRYNTFGASCSYNTFGTYCLSNTFGDNCSYNTFGTYCLSNTFGDNCSYNTFGTQCVGLGNIGNRVPLDFSYSEVKFIPSDGINKWWKININSNGVFVTEELLSND